MDILIKGLEMPKDDALSVIIYPDGVVEVQVGWNGAIPVYSNAFKATAIQVPEHGDLIERGWHLGEPSKYEQGWFLTKVMVRDCDGTFFPEYEACFKYEEWVDRRHQQPVVAYQLIEPTEVI